jgi:hypothetical protein
MDYFGCHASHRTERALDKICRAEGDGHREVFEHGGSRALVIERIDLNDELRGATAFMRGTSRLFAANAGCQAVGLRTSGGCVMTG